MGFGTGLNFLLAWKLFCEISGGITSLHFHSCEKFPLAAPDIRLALESFPQLNPYLERFLEKYDTLSSPVAAGVVSWHWDNVWLHLFLGDVAGALHCMSKQGNFPVDAWFLDGFSPAKNPDMWTGEIFQAMADLSVSGTTFATYSAAGFVKRGLIQSGFSAERTRGYGRKRDMLQGIFPGAMPG